MADRDYTSQVHRFTTGRQTSQSGNGRIGKMHGDPLPVPYSGPVLTMHSSVEHLMLLPQISSSCGHEASSAIRFAGNISTELVAELRDYAACK